MVDVGTGLVGIAAAIAIAGSALGAAIAQKSIGAAAIGAMAEKEELFVKGLILTVIPETLVILGFVIAYLLLAGGGLIGG
jgi:V/A-type H+-transporting ATPase subunit K